MKINKAALPRIFLIACAFLLATLFVLPLWRITLKAPQYPDGVHMHIHINKIDGAEPGTLQNVNILNHYIGMRPIEPDSIPELKYMPYIIIGFIILALLTAYMDKKWWYVTWIGLFTVAMLLGLYDFYLWEYAYGHDLDPKAPMQFEDSFQPPLIGKKTIINFVAISMPHVGGWLAILAAWLATFAAIIKFKT